MTTNDKALAWWAALTPEKITLLYLNEQLGEVEIPDSENYTKAEYLWKELLGVVMINEQGGLLSSEQTAKLRQVLKDYKPQKIG